MENLKALIYTGNITPYQKALAQREFEGLIERLNTYEAERDKKLLINFIDWYNVNRPKYEVPEIEDVNEFLGG